MGIYCIWSLSQPEFLLPVLEQENLIQPTSDHEDDTDNPKHVSQLSTLDIPVIIIVFHPIYNDSDANASPSHYRKPYLWQRVDIRHDITNQFLLYRFQKAAWSDPFPTTRRGGGAQPFSSRLPRHSSHNKKKNNHRQLGA